MSTHYDDKLLFHMLNNVALILQGHEEVMENFLEYLEGAYRMVTGIIINISFFFALFIFILTCIVVVVLVVVVNGTRILVPLWNLLSTVVSERVVDVRSLESAFPTTRVSLFVRARPGSCSLVVHLDVHLHFVTVDNLFALE